MPLRILMLYRQESAVGYYRSRLPARALRRAGHTVSELEENYEAAMGANPIAWVERQYGKFDLIIADRTLRYSDIAIFAGLRHTNRGSRLIVDFDDDYTNVPPWNTAHTSYQVGQQYREAGHAHLKLSELCTVSTPVIAERFKGRTHAVRTCLNFIDPADWVDLPTDPFEDDCLRVLYGGASGHYGDLDVAKEGILAVIDKPPVPFRLLCFGALPSWLHDASRRHPGRVVALPWIPFSDYPQAIAWGRFDIALAPLADHPFNEAKSNIKWLEAAIQGIPFLCSKVGPYAEIPDGAAIRVTNTPVQWAEGLRALLKDTKLRHELREEASRIVRDEWTIDQRGKAWQDAVEEAMSLPRIESLEATRLPHERSVSPAPSSP